ncbi:MAG TPA: hypothetical protein VMM18_14105 [Gemmatimonadaceae bacterium]|nr:hypothetical protein [Gemmatimonadaceae bacterium]
MKELKERDAMICRSCGNEERASEGYPCNDCGTFICVICNFRGVVLCKACTEKKSAAENGLGERDEGRGTRDEGRET